MHLKIQYRVYKDKVEENKKAVCKFIEGIKAQNDPEVSYTSYLLGDDVTFVHLAWFANEEAKKRFQSPPHFKEFAAGLPARCEEKPSVAPLELVASSK